MSSTRAKRLVGVGGLILLGLAGCRAPIDGLSPVTSRGDAIADLFRLALALSALIVLLVTGLLAYVIVRYRDRGQPGDPEPPQIHGNTRLEIAWTAAPTALLTVLFLLTLQTMCTVQAEVPPGDAVDVRVVGRQWWWEYQYVDLGFVTANELHVPVGQTVRLRIEAADVIHSFWVPQLGWKRDGTPGNRPNDILAEIAQPGIYDGTCTEYCGSQHAWMRVRLAAEPPDQFQTWVRQQQGPALPPQGPTALRGQRIFIENTCVNCHTIQGVTAALQVGPDLTHVGSRSTLGAGVVANTPENLQRWVRAVQAVKPGALMPNYDTLPDDDLAALVEYLSGLK